MALWPLFFRSKIGVFDVFFKIAKNVLKIKNSIVIENFKPVPLCLLKWRPLKVFAKLHKSPLLIASIFKGAVSGYRQFLATENPSKIINAFYFILTNWICYWQIRFCSYFAFSLNQISDIREAWKYWLLKDSFRSILQRFCRAANLWLVEQITSNF